MKAKNNPWCSQTWLVVVAGLLLTTMRASGECTRVSWSDVCAHDKRLCVVVSSYCPPQNSLIKTIQAGSLSRVGDGGYTIEVWPYQQCVGSLTPMECKDDADAYLQTIVTAAAADPDYTYDGLNAWEEWTVAEIRASNLVVQGYKGRVPYDIVFTGEIANQNAALGIQGVLCRVFWLTGRNVTIRDARIDTTDCCGYFINHQTSAAECTPIVCTAADCSNLRVVNATVDGASAAVRIQRDDRGLTNAHNVSILLKRPLRYVNGETPVALVAFDVQGSLAVASAVPSTVILKTGTYDTTITVTSNVKVLNVSDYVSPLKALFIDEEPLTYEHESPQNVYEAVIYLTAVLLGGILLLVVMAVVVHAIKKDVHDDGEKSKGE
jgi:hypothetical protein